MGQAKREPGNRFYETVTVLTETVVALAGLTRQDTTPMNAPTRARLLAAGLAIVPLAWSTGCLLAAGAAAGAATVAYVRGELSASISHGIDAVDRATNRAAEQLRFVKISESSDALLRVITLRTAEDKKIEVRLARTTDTLTSVKIRVGMLGDEGTSRVLLDKINQNL
jgi:hypothetical protein